MKINIPRVVLCVAIACVLAACGRSTGDQFVGNWRPVSGQGPDISIGRNGDNYLVGHKAPNFAAQDQAHALRNVQFSAIAQGDQLIVSTPLGPVAATIDKSNGHLIFHDEYVRVDKGANQ